MPANNVQTAVRALVDGQGRYVAVGDPVKPFKLNTSMFMHPAHLPPSAWMGHIPFAAWIIEELRPRIFVELGTHHGTSYLGFCQAVLENGVSTKCYAVDTWQGDEHAGEYGNDVYEALTKSNSESYAGFSQLLRMTFDEALPYFADGSVDLLHIDGLHTHEAVLHDFETWLPKLSDRGVILFHDTMVRENNFGVWKLWSDVAKKYPSFEFQHSHGLGVLMVGNSAPDSIRSLAGTETIEQSNPVLRLFDCLGIRIKQLARLGELEQLVVAREATVRQCEQTRAELYEQIRQYEHNKDEQTRQHTHALEDVYSQIRQYEQNRTDLYEQIRQYEHNKEELTRQHGQALEELYGQIREHENVQKAQHQEIRQISEATEMQVARLEAQVGALEKELALIVQSRSWAVTKPLRWVTQHLRGRA